MPPAAGIRSAISFSMMFGNRLLLIGLVVCQFNDAFSEAVTGFIFVDVVEWGQFTYLCNEFR